MARTEYSEDSSSRSDVLINEFGRPPEWVVDRGEESVIRWFVGKIEERMIRDLDNPPIRQMDAQVRVEYLRRMVQLLAREK